MLPDDNTTEYCAAATLRRLDFAANRGQTSPFTQDGGVSSLQFAEDVWREQHSATCQARC
jgi:hypothetical protein